MHLHKCSILCFSYIQKRTHKKNPLPSAISPPIRHACKFFWCADHYPGLNFHVCMLVSSSHSASMLLLVYQVCPVGGGLFLWCSDLWRWQWKGWKSTVSIHTHSRLVQIITSPKNLAGADLPVQSKREVGNPGRFLLLPQQSLASVTVLPPFSVRKIHINKYPN